MKTLNSKLMALMLTICVVGMGLLSIVSTTMFRQSLTEDSLLRISETTAKETQRINAWLANQVAYVSAFATEMSFMDDYVKEAMLPRLNAHVQANPQYFDVFMGYPDGRVTFASGHEPDYAGGWSAVKRPWYVGAMKNVNAPFITLPYTDIQTGGLCITVSKAVLKDGDVAGVASADILIDQLFTIVDQASVGEDSYAFLTDGDGNILIHPNASYGPDQNDNFQNLKNIAAGQLAPLLTEPDGVPVRHKDNNGVESYFTKQTIEASGWTLYMAIPVHVINAPITGVITLLFILLAFVVAAAAFLIWHVVRRLVVRPVAILTHAAQTLAQGSTDVQIKDSRSDEIGQLMTSFNVMAQSIDAQAAMADAMAKGDLTAAVPIRSDADEVGKALGALRQTLIDFIGRIRDASQYVSKEAEQIAGSSQTLAQGATEQAATVQALFSAIRDIAEKTQLNEKKTLKVNEMSNEIAQSAERGAAQMEHMVEAVDEINKASSRISNVIRVIDDIAFQTNILALNAAVEAARAGVHGKGFAVVAEEVRTLAGRSAEAAKETAGLIQDSITKAVEGVRIAEETNQSLQGIMTGVEETAKLTSDVSAFVQEQRLSIESINQSVEQVNQVVGSNAASAEESASMSEELSSESERLANLVARFRLPEGMEAALPSRARRRY